MTLLDLLDKNLIKIPLLSTDKSGVIDELLNVYKAEVDVSDEVFTSIRKSIFDRELQGSTVMENSVAIPHAKVAGINKAAVVIGVSRLGVDFGGSERSKVFFLVIAPSDKPSEHIQLLASIAKLCSAPVISRLMQGARNSDELYGFLVG